MTALDFVTRSLVLAVALLVLVRIVGKRLIGEVAAADLVVGVTVGTIAGSTAINDKVPLWGGLLALLVWGFFAWALTFATSRIPTLETLLNGQALTLVRKGTISSDTLRQAMLSERALRSMLRVQQVEKLSDVEKASLEPSGKLGVITAQRPGSS